MVQLVKLVFGFEDEFNQTAASEYIQKYWHYSVYISAFYVVTIFSIKWYMVDRPKYNLRRPLMCWSLLLAVFSILGFFKTGLRHWSHFWVNGWKASVCDPVIVSGQPGYWTFLFCLSKAPELVDTYFVVLRKQKLIFLHWYHHITVFLFCWYSYGQFSSLQQWFITMNFFVHSIMYSYYALRASGLYKPPVWVNMFITSLQLIQMVIGVWVNIYVFVNMSTDPSWYCNSKTKKSYKIINLALLMYASYFILFAEFFYSSYISKSAKAVEKSNKSNHQLDQNGVGSNGVSGVDKPLLNGHMNNSLKQRKVFNETNKN